MELESRIDKRLWATIESPYQNHHYTIAILDSIHFLNQLIRDKSGLESDGQTLAGEAFGGANPRLKVNSLQSESDKNVQKGVEALLRGLAQAIRNPRSHGLHKDTDQDADALILFVDLLVRIIDQSKSPFEKSAFLERVCDDPYFPTDSARYAELLVEEVPSGKRLEILIAVFKRRDHSNLPKVRSFCETALKALSPEEVNQFCSVVSDELKTTVNDFDIRSAIEVVPSELWPRHAEAVRLRVESKLIQSVRAGKYNRATDKCQDGALGTWILSRVPYLLLSRELGLVLTAKLDSKEVLQQDYVFKYLFYTLFALDPVPNKRLARAILFGLSTGDKRFHNALEWMHMIPSGLPEAWEEAFGKAIDDFQEAISTNRDAASLAEGITDDDVPF